VYAFEHRGHGQRRPLGQRLRKSRRFLHQIGGRNDLVHQADREGFGGRQAFAEEDHVERLGFPEQPRQSLDAAPAGGDAQVDFRQTDERLGIVRHDAEMAGDRRFAAAAQGVAVDGGDVGFGGARDGVHDFIAVGAFGDVGDVGDVHAGGKSLLARARDDDGARFLAFFNGGDGIEKFLADAQVDRIHGRTVENDRRDKILRGDNNVFVFHLFSPFVNEQR